MQGQKKHPTIREHLGAGPCITLTGARIHQASTSHTAAGSQVALVRGAMQSCLELRACRKHWAVAGQKLNGPFSLVTNACLVCRFVCAFGFPGLFLFSTPQGPTSGCCLQEPWLPEFPEPGWASSQVQRPLGTKTEERFLQFLV